MWPSDDLVVLGMIWSYLEGQDSRLWYASVYPGSQWNNKHKEPAAGPGQEPGLQTATPSFCALQGGVRIIPKGCSVDKVPYCCLSNHTVILCHTPGFLKWPAPQKGSCTGWLTSWLSLGSNLCFNASQLSDPGEVTQFLWVALSSLVKWR